MATKKKKEKLVKREHQGELSKELTDMFDPRENLDGITPRLPQIGIAHPAQVFKWPDGTKIEEFHGIILDKNSCNAWWKESFASGGGNPPDCFSLNGIRPEADSPHIQSELCATCDQNKFGSGTRQDGSPGRGKACKNMKRVHILIQGENLPKRLTLPPSSIRSLENYLTILADQGLPSPLVVTRLYLESTKNRDGIEYSEVRFEKTGVITELTAAQHIKKVRAEYMSAMRDQKIEAEEAHGTQEGSSDTVPFDNQF